MKNQKKYSKDGGGGYNGRWALERSSHINMVFDRFDSTNTIESYKMKLHNSKSSVVNCFEAKNHTQL
jgi:hypothetical protein